MASGKPVVRQIAWVSLAIQLLILLVAVILISFLIGSVPAAIDITMCLYLFTSIALRQLVPRAHRRGMRAFRKEQYAQAVEAFKESYSFFTRHPWIDRYRFITLLSSSRMSYQEMALVNTAFCYTQIGEGAMAQRYYKKALAQFPESEMAKTALRMLAAAPGEADTAQAGTDNGCGTA